MKSDISFWSEIGPISNIGLGQAQLKHTIITSEEVDPPEASAASQAHWLTATGAGPANPAACNQPHLHLTTNTLFHFALFSHTHTSVKASLN